MQAEEKLPSARRLVIGSILLLLVLGSGIMGIYLRKTRGIEQEAKLRLARLNAGPSVKAVPAVLTSSARELSFVGETVPYQNVTLYAKISGYIDKIPVDKGDKVKEGQFLASLISPEVDQQYNSARADLENKKNILKRDESLLAKEYISKEDEEKAETDVKMAEADVKSLLEQQEYKSIRAPFNGTITARFTDPGSLVQNAANAQTSSQPVVTIAELDRIRTYIFVEQKDASFIKPGYPVTITLADKPSFKLSARVTRATGELDSRTRMMTVEIDIDNSKDSIIPGSYVNVHVQVPGSEKLNVPSEALVVRNNKYFVPVVDDSSRVHYREITLAENTGIVLRITSGLKAGEKVVLNLGETVLDGQKVRVIQ